MSSTAGFPRIADRTEHKNAPGRSWNAPAAGDHPPGARDRIVISLHRRARDLIEEVLSGTNSGQAGTWTVRSFNGARIPVRRNGPTWKTLMPGSTGTHEQPQPSGRHPHDRPSAAAGPAGNGPHDPRRRNATDPRRGRRCSEDQGTPRGHRRPPMKQRFIEWLGLDLLEYERDL